jgi:tetratricopeptide (TPR) repeat protein
MKNSIAKLILPVLIFIIASTVIIFAAPDTDKDPAGRIQQRIEKLSSILANEPVKGIDVEKAKDLLAKAKQMVKAGKYDEARKLTDEVAKMINPDGKGIKDRKRDQLNGNPGKQNFGKKNRELTNDEKKKIKSEIDNMLKDLKNLVDKEKYDEASRLNHEIQIRLFALSGRKPEMPGRDGMMGGDKQNKGPMMNQGPFQKGNGPGFGGNKMNRQGAPGEGMQNREKQMNMLFEKARQEGPDGFKKASEMFEKIVDRQKENGRELNSDAKALYKKAIVLNEDGKTDEAFNTLKIAFIKQSDSIETRGLKNQDKEGRGMFGPGELRKNDQRGPKRGNDMPPAVQELMKSLKQLSMEYIDKHGEDDFITGCKDEVMKIMKGAKAGDTAPEDTIEKLEGIREKIKREL